ncbi:histidine kinase [Paenibacillus darwinianus]|uniref:histidine kinase n=1 Tax=Paenibacillus darwinianus TaxID=1380763 RepID=A0A9W5S281_9BACL|nr:PAS domain-containing sensor histidine kinase [Paenibacillus darwinianus]EXX86016.1 histidine kinase [Paenibacillus darwinianus]EXX88787.1 histidine kinase [Paenibacillus darwinianus]EXX89758.1 histidine kinase [Paenibacillus darwinianus]
MQLLSSINNTNITLVSFLNLTSDGIAIVDLEGRVIELNHKFEEMHGWTRDEVIGMVLPMTPERDKAAVFHLYERIVRGEDVLGMECWKLRKDGTSFYADVTISPIRDEHGEVIAFVGVERDITDKKKAEEQLKESEERYRVLVETSPEPIVVYRDDVIEFVNPATVKLFGARNPSELIGRHITRFVHAEDLASLPRQLRELIETGRTSEVLNKRLLRLDGQVIYVEVKVVPIKFQGHRAAQLLFRDVTDRRIAEDALAEREREFTRVLKLSPEPIILLRDGIINFANDQGIELFGGMNEGELIGRPIFDFFCKTYHPTIVERMNQAIQTNDSMDFIELKLRRLDGNELDVELSCIYIYKHIDSPLLQIVIRDMTERKRTEEMIRRSEKLSIVGELAAGVAHEIRNPLTSLKGFLQLLQQKNTVYVDIMLIEIERINNIVNEFMSIAKPHAVQFVETDLRALIENVIYLMEPQSLLFNVQMTLHVDPDVRTIYCEPNQIKQVFMNLLKNAIESMPHGGTIEIAIRQRENDGVSIRIVDQGIGIPKEKLAKLGEPFYSLKENGTGLGLMVCHRIIETHNGTMSIQSKLKEGTVVEIEIPVK